MDADIKAIKVTKEKLIEAYNAEKHEKWQLYTNSNIKVYVENKNKNGVCSVCGTGIINTSAKKIIEEIRNESNWKKIDNMLNISEYIDLAEDQRIINLKFKGIPLLFSQRDVVFLESVHKNKDGTFMITSTPTSCQIYPKTQDYTRVDLISGGWYIQPIDKNVCMVTYYTNIDLKMDYVTPPILNLFVSKIPSVICKIEEITNSKK